MKYAGAHAGRVKEIRLIPRQDQDKDPGTTLFNCVDVVIDVDSKLEIGRDVAVTIKQGRVRHRGQVRSSHAGSGS